MTVFILQHQNFITQNALKRDTSPMAEIVKLIDSGDHIKSRYPFVDFNLKCISKRFSKAREQDNPFNCTGSIRDVTCNCALFQLARKYIKEECSQCKSPRRVDNMKSCKVFCLVHADISHPQEKILDATGYNGRIKDPCY